MPVFGPVPSRRLGNSLGVNNIPPKICSYACRYCQLGKTLRMSLDPLPYFTTEQICGEVGEILAAYAGHVDYLTVVPDGEPTLDQNLGQLALGLKRFGIPVAVISNGSLITRKEVRQALTQFDWVSLKVDAVTEAIWKQIDRPHPHLELESLLAGLLLFRGEYSGILNTETMLVKGLNDQEEELSKIARFLGRLRPDTAWISLPLRPPAESDALPADALVLQRALTLYREHVPIVEALNVPEGDDFSACGPDLGQAILDITSVHPIREKALKSLVARKGATWDIVRALVDEESLIRAEWEGETFYRRNLEKASAPHSSD